MTGRPEKVVELRDLVSRLRSSPKVMELGEPLGPEGSEELATEIAAGLIDIRQSTDRIFGELLPRLEVLQPTEQDFADVLHAIGEEYRHIYYHLRNTRFFDYVIPDL